MNGYLGIDVGSVSTNLVVINSEGEVLEKIYLRTKGQPIDVVQRGLKELKQSLADDIEIKGVGTTGSGRNLTSVVVGADTVKNEITAHAVASSHIVPDVRTVLEIGGQDSKITILRNGIVVDFAMNTVCAAGTGSFLDQQAARLGIPIEDFGKMALKSKNKVRIAGRCSVFAESDMIHKQQMGHNLEDIIAGLCEALVRNYLNNVGQGKDILAPVVFQGGVAANEGIKEAFAEALETEIVVPEHHDVMGAIGAALLAKDKIVNDGEETSFKGWNVTEIEYTPSSFECEGCANLCEVIEIRMDGEIVSRWGHRCNKWDLAQ
ncbi:MULTISPECIES: acyl-CoA dehydratase activase [unclassified Candidatus Frackibacter]|uniref:acyl-CoA dehydratase activase n=1 Tax=unclassified Candidatus Frackibacter TaxID=2648818 RepID=UPI0008CEB560|nr:MULTISPECIES: acyl-CoA dehydratase activase [unclassified Candidatus Frackibacter]SEM36589.1 CoA-substrate-specific enzyme activase, putative [Candidatus Frackibacter sp. WG12]SFL41898.1 CoA-substrate-specific enzyme activase, putative [Candidatus Frackibacter sp. WG13]